MPGVDKEIIHICGCMDALVTLGIFVGFVVLHFIGRGSPLDPRFGVESASVSMDNINNTAAAEWDLVVSARNPNKKHSVNYQQFDVYIQLSTSQDWILAAANVGPFRQGSKNMTLVNANVKTLLPPGYSVLPDRGMVWSVMLRAKINGDKEIEAFCRNMKVVFAQNATKGLLAGSGIECPAGDIRYDN